MTRRLQEFRAAAITVAASRAFDVHLSRSRADALAQYQSVEMAVDRLELHLRAEIRKDTPDQNPTARGKTRAVEDAVSAVEAFVSGSPLRRELMKEMYDEGVVFHQLVDSFAAVQTGIPQILDELRRRVPFMTSWLDAVERLYNGQRRKLELFVDDADTRGEYSRRLDFLYREHIALAASSVRVS
jgi:hypothetical protein